MLITFTGLKYIVVCIGPDAPSPQPQLFFILPTLHSVNLQFLQTCHASGTWECKPYEPCPPVSQYLEEDGPEITEEAPKGRKCWRKCPAQYLRQSRENFIDEDMIQWNLEKGGGINGAEKMEQKVCFRKIGCMWTPQEMEDLVYFGTSSSWRCLPC